MTAILSLSLISGPDQVRLETRVVEGYEFTLGRGQDADWSLLDPETNILSRRHCMLSQEDGDWWLLDMSGNGTFLNHEREPIGDGGKRRLRDGDRIRLGAYEFQAQLAGPTEPSVRAEAEPWPSLRDTMDGPIGTIPLGGGDQGAMARGRDGGGFANPFADDEEEAAAPVRPGPGAIPPAGRSGNPFADLRDDAADDGWPPAGSAPPRPAEPLADQASPFADRAEDRAAAPAAEPRPARRPTAWITEPPIGSPPRDASPTPAPPPAVAPVPNSPAPNSPESEAQAANPFAEPGDAEAADEPVVPLVSVTDALPPVTERDPPVVHPEASPFAPPVAGPGPVAPVTPLGAPTVTAPTVTVPTEAVPPGVAPPTAQDDILLRALLQGAGIPDASPRDPEQSLRALGAAFRAMITGLREVQRARRTVRGGFRIAQTAWTENPLKLAVNEDDALEALLGAGRRSAMPPARAVEEVLKEIVLHEVATVAAMQEAVRTLLASLSPDKLREIAEQGAGLTVLPAQRKARAWDTYEATHARVTAALQDDFDSVFGRAFARAYERVMAEQKE